MSAIVSRSALARLSPDEAAALWMVNRDAGHPVEAGLFEEWLDASDAHREAWRLLSQDWALFDVKDDPEFAELRARAQADRGTSFQRWRGPATALAAAVIAVVGGTIGFRVLRPDMEQPASVATADVTYATTSSGRRIVLPDGTDMALAPRTTVKVAFSASERAVALNRGKASFAVTHNAMHPFSVAVQGRVVTDLGTRFEVGLESDLLRVALFEGKVRIGDAGQDVLLVPGQQFVARAGQPGSITLIAAPKAAAEASQLVQFDDVRLADAIQQMNEGSPVQIVIPDPRVGDMRISGRFRLHDAARFANAVTALLPVRSVKKGPRITELRPRR